MEDIKPKKERKFLKAVGKVAGILLQEFVLGLGRKFIRKKIDRIDNKRQTLLIFLALFCNIGFASIDSIPYPITGNKQRLGWQTTGNGLVWRGLASDTITKPTNYADKNVKAYLILDSVTGSLFVFKQGVWAAISGAGGGLTMPFDSITFNTAKDGTVGVGEVEYNDTQGSLIQGLKGGNVTNVIGQQLHQRVNNKTGATLAKGDVVYLSGSQGNRITVAKAIATSDPTSANTFGIVAESIADNQSGYVITEGLITGLNTSALTQDSAVYLSGTTAGALTSTKPQAPIHGVYIGVCVKTSAGSGELFIKIRNGQELGELHDVQITSPVNNASLYYKSSEGIWRDTTAALLVSDTASMLANYPLKAYVDSIAQNFQDSIDEITNGYFKQEFSTVTKDTLNWTKSVQLPIGGSNLLLVYRNGQMLNDAQYSVIDTNKVKINSGSYKVGENYTVVYVKGGGGSGSGGVPFDTTTLNLVDRFALKLNIADTAAMLSNYATKAYADTTGRFYARQDFSNVSSATLTWTQSDTLITGNSEVLQVYRNGQILLPSQYTVTNSTTITIALTSYKAGENYTVIFPRGGGAGSGGGGSGSLTSISGGTGITVSPNPITTTGTVSADLSVLMELSDTVTLSNRINLKLNSTDTASLSNRINSKLNTADTVSLSNRINTKLNTTDTVNLSNRINLKLNAADTASLSNRINAKGTGTVTSVATGYGLSGGTITTTGTLVLDSAVVFSRIKDSIVDVAIGNDTIKILKQEYNAASSSVLTWTVTSKFPIQLKAFILVFRNGQLLINDQYNLTDTNKITIVSNSFKVGANYTVVTVSGIGSVGSAQAGNPVYPDAGIALSTGTTWASSIPNNSTNWNTAYTDRLKWDGGSTGLTPSTARTSLGGTTIGQSVFTLTNPSAVTFPQFNADNTTTALSATDFRTAIGAGTGNGNGTVTSVTVAAGTPLSVSNTTTTPQISMSAATGSVNGYLSSTDWTNFNTAYNDKIASLNFTGTSTKTLTLNQTDGGTVTGTFTDLQGIVAGDTATMLSPYLRKLDTASLSNRINLKLNISDTLSMLSPYLRKLDTVSLSNRINLKLNISDTAFMLTNYLRSGVAASTYQTKLTNPITGTGVSSFLPRFTGTSTLDSTRLFYSNGRFGVNMDASEAATHLTSRFVVRDFGHNFKFDGSAAGSGYTTTISHDDTGLKIGNSSNIRDIRFTLNGTSGLTIANNSNSPARAVGIANDSPTHQLDVTGTFRATGAATLGSTLTVTGATTLSTTTATPTSLLGKDASGVVGTVTLGSGLTLSSGTLTASGATGVTSVTATSPISSSGGSTPNITITDASTTTSGVITTGTQSIAGAKTFTSATVINGGLVVNEDGSSVGTFRVEGDNNTSLIQTAPASDYVGIGRVPENSFDVQGAVRFRTLTLNGTPTRIIGADATGDINQITLGSGLSLSSGTLSATNTGTVTNVTGTLPISVANGTTTPSITIANASASASGVVSTGTQSFAGSKTFTGLVGMQKALQRPVETITVGSASITTSNTWVIINNAGTCTLTLPSASSSTGTEFFIKTITNNTVISASSNIVPLAGGSAGTAILSATAGKWATLVSDGTNWIIMQAN